MLTIGQLAAYAGVTVRAVRHYHQIGLLPEPERDASGYRRYGATGGRVPHQDPHPRRRRRAAVRRSAQMLEADAPAFAEAVQKIDNHLRDEIERLETSRKQIAQLAAGDSLVLPPEVVAYLDRLREIGVSERMVEGERDGVDPDRGPLARPHPRVDARESSRSSMTRKSSGSTRSLSELLDSDAATTTRAWRKPPTSWPGWPSRPTPPVTPASAKRLTTTCRSTCWTHWPTSTTRGWHGYRN